MSDNSSLPPPLPQMPAKVALNSIKLWFSEQWLTVLGACFLILGLWQVIAYLNILDYFTLSIRLSLLGALCGLITYYGYKQTRPLLSGALILVGISGICSCILAGQHYFLLSNTYALVSMLATIGTGAYIATLKDNPFITLLTSMGILLTPVLTQNYPLFYVGLTFVTYLTFANLLRNHARYYLTLILSLPLISFLIYVPNGANFFNDNLWYWAPFPILALFFTYSYLFAVPESKGTGLVLSQVFFLPTLFSQFGTDIQEARSIWLAIGAYWFLEYHLTKRQSFLTGALISGLFALLVSLHFLPSYAVISIIALLLTLVGVYLNNKFLKVFSLFTLAMAVFLSLSAYSSVIFYKNLWFFIPATVVLITNFIQRDIKLYYLLHGFSLFVLLTSHIIGPLHLNLILLLFISATFFTGWITRSIPTCNVALLGFYALVVKLLIFDIKVNNQALTGLIYILLGGTFLVLAYLAPKIRKQLEAIA